MPNAEIGARADLKVIDPKEIPHILKEGELGAVLEWAVTQPDGKVIEHVVKKSESFVQQFLQLLYARMTRAMSNNTVSIRDTGNTLRSVIDWHNFSSGYILDVKGPGADNTYGIVVGTDAGGPHAPTISDYQLVTLIAHGVGAGAMQYGAVTFGPPGSDATTSQLTITRNLTANVGGITVNEVGLYCRAFDGVERKFMIIRDVAVIAVAVGNTLTINYRLQATV
jgi:hypothetical protein